MPAWARWWLEGYLELEVRARRLADLINSLLAARMRFRTRMGRDGAMLLRLPLRDFRRMRPMARVARARVRVRARRGLPFLVRRIARRPGFLMASVLAAVLLTVLSGRVWFVQVQGADRVSPLEVLAAARVLGLQPGAAKARLDPQAIARRLPVEVPDLAWAAVHIQGILARVTVAERLRSAPLLQLQTVPGDVVAAHAGRIWAITTVSGTPEVEPGAEVRAGQVLIAGLVQMPVARKRGVGSRGIAAVAVHASGIVIARRWYSTYAEAPRTLDLGVPTGRVAVRRVLVIGAWQLALQGWRAVPFASYEASQTQWGPPVWGPLSVPVHVTTVRYREVRPALRRLSLSQARQLAAAEARAYLLTVLPAGARIVAERESWQELPGGGVGVELHVESEDNIGVFRPMPQGDVGQSKGSG